MEKCLILLKNEGMVIVCENAPFGVLQPQLKKEDGAEKENRQHFHNFFSDDFVKIAKELPFSVEFIKKVGKNTSNQWIVLLKKQNEKDIANKPKA